MNLRPATSNQQPAFMNGDQHKMFMAKPLVFRELFLMQRNFYSRKNVSFLCGIIALLTGFAISPAIAQGKLEEVIIVAEEPTNQVLDDLVSVSILSGEKLADAGIENIEDVAAYVPNLVLAETETGTSIFIRGIGAGVNQGFDQSVGLYSDGVPLPRSHMARAPFLDLENVQVLRGPQYVLDGNYSIAGSVHMMTRQATEDFKADMDFSYIPSQGDKKLLLTASLPLTDRFGIRFALQSQKAEGYVENVLRKAQQDELLFRTVLGWAPTDNLSITFKFEKGRFDKKGRNIEIIQNELTPDITQFPNYRNAKGIERGAAGFTGGSTVLTEFVNEFDYLTTPFRTRWDAGDITKRKDGAPVPTGSIVPLEDQAFYWSGRSYLGRIYENYLQGVTDGIITIDDIPAGLLDDELNFKRSADADEFSNNDSTNYTLNLNYWLGEHNISLVSSYIDYQVDELIDADFTGAPLLTTTQQEEYTQLFQRLDYRSPVGQFIELKVGASYLDSELSFSDNLDAQVQGPELFDGASISAWINDFVGRLPRATVFDPQYPLSTLFGRLSGGLNIILPFEVFSPARQFDQKNKITAAFLNTTINWSDEFRTVIGARYTHSEKEAQREYVLQTTNGELLQFTGNSITDATLSNSLTRAVDIFGKFFGIQNHSDAYDLSIDSRLAPLLRGKRREESFLPSISLEWDMSPDLTWLAAIRQANKLGGFDARSNATPDVPLGLGLFPGTFEFEDESAVTYEMGIKWVFPRALGEMYATVFYTDFEDLQVSRSDGRLGFAVENAGAASTAGIEIEGYLSLTDALELKYSLAWIDFEFKDYIKGSCPLGRRADNFLIATERAGEIVGGINTGDVIPIQYETSTPVDKPDSSIPYLGTITPPGPSNGEKIDDFNEILLISPAFCDFAGQTNQFVAEWQGTFTFDYTTGFGNFAVLKPTLDILYNSGYHTTVTQDDDVAQEEYIQINARLALASLDDSWEVAFTGHNLTNRKIVTYAAETPIATRIAGSKGHYGFVRPPRSIGLNLKYKFY